MLEHEVSPRYARLLNNATHWGFGLATGAGYGLFLGSGRNPKVWYGLPFGAAVSAGGYVVLPQLGVYKPIWKYDLETLEKDPVTTLAHRIAAFPAAGHLAVKDRVNAILLAPADDFRGDSDLFGDGVRYTETQRLIEAAF